MPAGQEGMNYTNATQKSPTQTPDVYKQNIEGSGREVTHDKQPFDFVKHEMSESGSEGQWQKVDSRWKAVSKDFKKRCQAFMSQGNSEVSTTLTERQIFLQERGINAREVKVRQSILQDFYEGLPPLPLQLKEYAPNVAAFLPGESRDHIRLEAMTRQITEMESSGRRANFLHIVKSSIESRLDQRREWESQMVGRVGVLKKIQSEARLLRDAQHTNEDVEPFFSTVKKDIDQAYTLLIENALQHDADASRYFHSSQLHPCPPELSLKVLKQSRQMDCGPACVTALYSYHVRDNGVDLEQGVKEVYQYYDDKRLDEQGSNISHCAGVLRKLSVPIEPFATVRMLRERLTSFSDSHEVSPIMTAISVAGSDRDRYRHAILIADTTVNQDNEERIPFADPLTGTSHLVSFDDFLRVSDREYIRLL